jgi:hypothetical protein
MWSTGTLSARHPAIPLLISTDTREQENILESRQFSYSESSNDNTQSSLDSRIPIGSIRSIKLIGIPDPLDIGILLDIIQLKMSRCLMTHVK